MPGQALACTIASRSEQSSAVHKPSFVSTTLVTTKVGPAQILAKTSPRLQAIVNTTRAVRTARDLVKSFPPLPFIVPLLCIRTECLQALGYDLPLAKST